MADYGENYQNNGGQTMCPLCLTHLDSQVFSFSGQTIVKNVAIGGKQYKDIINKIDSELDNTLLSIRKFREEYVNTRMRE